MYQGFQPVDNFCSPEWEIGALAPVFMLFLKTILGIWDYTF